MLGTAIFCRIQSTRTRVGSEAARLGMLLFVTNLGSEGMLLLHLHQIPKREEKRKADTTVTRETPQVTPLSSLKRKVVSHIQPSCLEASVNREARLFTYLRTHETGIGVGRHKTARNCGIFGPSWFELFRLELSLSLPVLIRRYWVGSWGFDWTSFFLFPFFLYVLWARKQAEAMYCPPYHVWIVVWIPGIRFFFGSGLCFHPFLPSSRRQSILGFGRQAQPKADETTPYPIRSDLVPWAYG
ncbi:hypothetical protein BDP55DRAFT_145725 [Colletotrichum godetiae]|uniref:Uncharacterized protein n=1 Tax=Colletotrichum godetiae TaxID=1209918 RepID=A0AAJ0AKM5_9PEZI|nr:uncharacterized protein BDP55DRAFT_145725 [Colletotrichum godetiae]KAK1675633.1 hypothetical protein BDP55DRAFT_145725 [Colletotrichum godetiae]